MTRLQDPKTGMHTFLTVWVGQLFSLVGSAMTGFALGIWLYQTTGSVTSLAIVAFASQLAMIIVSPIAGTLADRWDRRHVMILSDGGAGLSTLFIVALLFSNHLEAWHIYLAVTASAAFRAFQWPAYSASITQLVPEDQLGRVNGMVQIGRAIAEILAPAFAGILIVRIHLKGIIVIDLITFMLAVSTLLWVKFQPLTRTEAGERGKGSFWQETIYGWRYISKHSGLLAMLIFLVVINFDFGVINVLFTPLILSFSSPTTLGTVITVAGIGMLGGSLLMSIWGGPKRRIHGVLGFGIVQGICLVIGGMYPNALVIAIAAFFFLFSIPIIVSSAEAIWQSRVEPDVQGRVFGMRNMIASASLPLASLSAGSLTDAVFEPLLATDGPWAHSIGQVIGMGPGRGAGFFFIILGLGTLLSTLAGYSYPPLRSLADTSSPVKSQIEIRSQ